MIFFDSPWFYIPMIVSGIFIIIAQVSYCFYTYVFSRKNGEAHPEILAEEEIPEEEEKEGGAKDYNVSKKNGLQPREREFPKTSFESAESVGAASFRDLENSPRESGKFLSPGKGINQGMSDENSDRSKRGSASSSIYEIQEISSTEGRSPYESSNARDIALRSAKEQDAGMLKEKTTMGESPYYSIASESNVGSGSPHQLGVLNDPLYKKDSPNSKLSGLSNIYPRIYIPSRYASTKTPFIFIDKSQRSHPIASLLKVPTKKGAQTKKDASTECSLTRSQSRNATSPKNVSFKFHHEEGEPEESQSLTSNGHYDDDDDDDYDDDKQQGLRLETPSRDVRMRREIPVGSAMGKADIKNGAPEVASTFQLKASYVHHKIFGGADAAKSPILGSDDGLNDVSATFGGDAEDPCKDRGIPKVGPRAAEMLLRISKVLENRVEQRKRKELIQHRHHCHSIHHHSPCPPCSPVSSLCLSAPLKFICYSQCPSAD